MRRGVLWTLLAAVLVAVGVRVGPTVGTAVSQAVAQLRTTAPAESTDERAAADDGDASDGGEDGGEAATTDERVTVLVATIGDDGTAVTGVELLTWDPASGRAAVVLVPTALVADVPGYGLLPLGDAGQFGGVPLLELTVENQLGIDVDATVRLGEQDWAALLTRIGGFEVEVRQPLTATDADGTSSTRFEAGPQFLDGPRLAEYLTWEQAGEDELTSFARVQQVYEGLLATAASEGTLDTVLDDGAPMLSASDVEVVGRALRGAAAATPADALVLRTLPVTEVGSGDAVFYRLDADRAGTFVADALGGGDLDPDRTEEGLRLEILNGNGTAGIGAAVAQRLVPLGHTVVITRNADAFTYDTTRVLLYGDDDEVLAQAQEIVETLGVGRIEINAVPSAIVDVTVLVGRDFAG